MLNIDPFEQAIPETQALPPQPDDRALRRAALGLLLGTALGFVHDWFDDRFRTVDEMREMTGLSCSESSRRCPKDLPRRLSDSNLCSNPCPQWLKPVG